MVPPTERAAFDLADAHFIACIRVRDFLADTVRPVVDRTVGTDDNAQTYSGLLARVEAWMHSLSKLNGPADFQAIDAATRGLFELAVEFTLLLHGPSDYVARVRGWEESAKLKACERLVAYYEQRKRPVPQRYHHYEDFVRRHGTAVQDMRDFFGWKRHPNRWTNQNLEVDAHAADGLENLGLAEFYAQRHAFVCWNLHGSGLTAVRHTSEESLSTMAMQGFRHSAHFAVLSARQCLRILDRFDDSIFLRFQRLEEESVAAMGQHLGIGSEEDDLG